MKTALAFSFLFLSAFARAESPTLTLLVGTATNGTSEGIYVYRLNTDDLTVKMLSTAKIDNPSYLTISGDGRYVYALSGGQRGSAVVAYSFDRDTGRLQFLNRTATGAGPCYIHLDGLSRFVATANYGGGSASIIGLNPDGTLFPEAQTYTFTGSGPNPARQTKPYLHCIIESPDNRFLYATDLGTDRVHKFMINSGKIAENSPFAEVKESVSVAPGSGPRHLIFNRTGRMAYLINELSGTVSVFECTDSRLKEVQTIVADTCNAGGSADIRLSPDGRFLYTSTRLQGDGIVIFKVGKGGKLTRIGYHPTGGHPRNFAVTPDGKLLLVACRDSGVIQIFRRDEKSGLLADTGKTIPVDKPMCVKVL